MHKSKLVALGIDCQTDDLGVAAKFWSKALGREPTPDANPKERYLNLGTQKEPLIVFLQRVEHPSRVHLDIETDDVEAEVKRLEALGAKRVQQIKTWWVLEAPTGHRFCVVKPQRGEMPADANVWP